MWLNKGVAQYVLLMVGNLSVAKTKCSGKLPLPVRSFILSTVAGTQCVLNTQIFQPGQGVCVVQAHNFSRLFAKHLEALSTLAEMLLLLLLNCNISPCARMLQAGKTRRAVQDADKRKLKRRIEHSAPGSVKVKAERKKKIIAELE